MSVTTIIGGIIFICCVGVIILAGMGKEIPAILPTIVLTALAYLMPSPANKDKLP